MRGGAIGIRAHEDVIVWAVRYCLQSGWRSTSHGIRVLVRNWGDLTESTRRRLVSELKERVLFEHEGKVDPPNDPNSRA